MGKRGARVFGFASASGGLHRNFESLPCLTRRHTPRSSIAANIYKSGTQGYLPVDFHIPTQGYFVPPLSFYFTVSWSRMESAIKSKQEQW